MSQAILRAFHRMASSSSSDFPAKAPSQISTVQFGYSYRATHFPSGVTTAITSRPAYSRSWLSYVALLLKKPCPLEPQHRRDALGHVHRRAASPVFDVAIGLLGNSSCRCHLYAGHSLALANTFQPVQCHHLRSSQPKVVLRFKIPQPKVVVNSLPQLFFVNPLHNPQLLL